MIDFLTVSGKNHRVQSRGKLFVYVRLGFIAFQTVRGGHETRVCGYKGRNQLVRKENGWAQADGKRSYAQSVGLLYFF